MDFLKMNGRKLFFIFSCSIILCFSLMSLIKKVERKNEFEGIITYSIELKSKKEYLSSEKLSQLYGSEMNLFIKNGNYKMVYNGNDIKEVYYLKKINKEYSLRKNMDTLYMASLEKEDRQLNSSKIIDTVVMINQRPCKVLINKVDNIINIYYFDTTLYLNPKNYKNYKFNYANLYYEKAKSQWLKYEFQGTSFNLIYTAKKIVEKKLNDSIFELPHVPVVNW
jgi:hypothetical protein